MPPPRSARAGTKYHVVVSTGRLPLAVAPSAANVHDSRLLLPVVDAIPPIWRPVGEPGRPRRRPAKLHADKAYTSAAHRRALRRRGILPRIARKGIEPRERLGRHRWVVERTNAWLLAFRRLTVRYDRHAVSVLAFLHLACALICLRFLRRAEAV